MASESQFILGDGAPGAAFGNCRFTETLLVPFTIAANGTLSTGPIPIAPSWITGVRIETPVAISGTPTSCLLRLGITAAGQEIVADVDAKAQGHIAATIVTAFDAVGNAAGNLFAQLVTAGGTSPAGTINLLVTFSPLPA